MSSPTKRTKDPTYTVLQVVENGEANLYRLISLEVKAPNREEAIKRSSKEVGTFLVMLAGHAQVIKRSSRQETIDEFESVS